MNWIIITICGAFFQNLRSLLQKKLNKNLSTVASTYVRFAFALPFATLLFFIYFRNFEIISIILVQSNFVYYTILGSVFQIIFTFILLYLFKFSNFVVGTALSKTEVIQVAIFEYFLLKDKLNIFGVFGIIIATVGVIIISVKDLKLFFNNFFSKTTLIGLTTGLFLALSVVYFRAAALSLENFSSNFEKAISTLFFGLVIQTFIITIYLFIFERSEFR
jgi:drug/metabolite transporter (DMT)-like permease